MNEKTIAELKELGEIIELEGFDCFAHYAEISAPDGFRCDNHDLPRIFPAPAVFNVFMTVPPVRKAICKFPCGCVFIQELKR